MARVSYIAAQGPFHVFLANGGSKSVAEYEIRPRTDLHQLRRALQTHTKGEGDAAMLPLLLSWLAGVVGGCCALAVAGVLLPGSDLTAGVSSVFTAAPASSVLTATGACPLSSTEQPAWKDLGSVSSCTSSTAHAFSASMGSAPIQVQIADCCPFSLNDSADVMVYADAAVYHSAFVLWSSP